MGMKGCRSYNCFAIEGACVSSCCDNLGIGALFCSDSSGCCVLDRKNITPTSCVYCATKRGPKREGGVPNRVI